MATTSSSSLGNTMTSNISVLSTLAPPLRAVITDLQAKLVRRHGDFGIHKAFLGLAASNNIEEGREALADLSARMADEAFEAMVDSEVTVATLIGAICLSLSVTRRVVVDAAWTSLCQRIGVTANPKGCAVPPGFLREQYDASRFVEVKNGSTTEERCLAEFADAFPDEANDVSYEEFASLCTGISLNRPSDDKQYQLHIVRAWNLDRASVSPAAAEAAAALLAERTAKKESSMGRSHPLYQTTQSRIGQGASDGATRAVIQYHRAGRFTKENPMPTPSAGLNCAPVRHTGRFM